MVRTSWRSSAESTSARDRGRRGSMGGTHRGKGAPWRLALVRVLWRGYAGAAHGGCARGKGGKGKSRATAGQTSSCSNTAKLRTSSSAKPGQRRRWCQKSCDDGTENGEKHSDVAWARKAMVIRVRRYRKAQGGRRRRFRGRQLCRKGCWTGWPIVVGAVWGETIKQSVAEWEP